MLKMLELLGQLQGIEPADAGRHILIIPPHWWRCQEGFILHDICAPDEDRAAIVCQDQQGCLLQHGIAICLNSTKANLSCTTHVHSGIWSRQGLYCMGSLVLFQQVALASLQSILLKGMLH